MDKIHIKGLEIYAYHGVNPEEKIEGQPFVLDIELSLNLKKPSETDDLEDTVSYAKAVKTVKAVMGEAKYDLIEKAAGRVVEQLLEDFPKVSQVHILLKKPKAPVKAEFEYMAVELTRGRADA